MNNINNFLATNREEMQARNWDACDIIIISGDAYVDHPTFGTALIGRVLESQGFRVGIIAQPRWDSTDDFLKLGIPTIACMITAGNLDSMVAHYTSGNKPRRSDSYSPGGKMGLRPDRAILTYSAKAKQVFKGIPLIIGGLEASLRRLAHYDYWSDKIRRSILLDAKADLLVFGMAEETVSTICERLKQGEPIASIQDVPGTLFAQTLKEEKDREPIYSYPEILLPDFQTISERDSTSNTGTPAGKRAYALSIQKRILHENPMRPERLIEHYPTHVVIQNPPIRPLSTEALDRVYELPFTRTWHPDYDKAGGIPALAEVKFSLASTRGCFGACTFCALTYHQGRVIQARSHESLVKEAKLLTEDPSFKGYIHDVGGPTANFRAPACKKQASAGPCSDRQCLFPEPCPALQDSHESYLSLLKEIREIKGIKKVFVRSGIRYDYLLRAPKKEVRDRFIKELAEHHTSGQLKVAPEHVVPRVLDAMGKPKIDLFEEFSSYFQKANKDADKKQYIIPYFISSHPGSTIGDAVQLALYLKKNHFIPDQIQDFYPTPGTVATCMYYTGLDPRPDRDFAEIYVPKGREKNLQRALLHFHKSENYHLVAEALKKADREDLIGNGPDCLIRKRSNPPQKRGRKRR